MKNKVTAILYAFMAAVFYAVNIPFSKILLKDIQPVFIVIGENMPELLG